MSAPYEPREHDHLVEPMFDALRGEPAAARRGGVLPWVIPLLLGAALLAWWLV